MSVPPTLAALLDVGASLVRRSPSGKLLMARMADVVSDEGLPRALRGGQLVPALQRAKAEACVPLKKVKLDREFDREPLAVTPGAQIHAGDGVVAKVRRPGVAAMVRSDLALLDMLAAPLGAVFGSVDVGAMLREVREMTLDELDLEHEAEMQRAARRALRDVVVVPEIREDDEDVLVMERLDGPTLMEAEPDDPGAVARALVDAHVTAWLDRGLILTDPRPGHVVLLADGRVGLLGTGIARPGDRTRGARLVDAFVALGDPSPDAFAAVVAGDLQMLPEDGAREAHGLLRELLGPFVEGEAKLDQAALAAVGDRGLRRLDALLALSREVTPQPSDIPAARMLGQLVAVLARLGASEDWIRTSARP